ncbi:MAG TPA: hypothetical protein VJ019_03990 [Aestuariivirga sp.]|jgi:hypothetical protein|nr:hypothetical protein [Aestuariivirga sp.]
MIRTKILATALLAVLASGTIATESNAAGVRYCKAYARDVANHRAGAPQVVGGLVGGAIAGGLIGAVIGGKHAVRTGAIVGGATGAVAGGVHANKKWDKIYWRAYRDCRSW